jgi:hypothetical protein
MEYATPDTLAGVDGVEEIAANDCELWVLAPYTVLDVDDQDSTKVKTSGGDPVTLRNDSDRMAMLLAGAIARYNQSRARATIVAQGLMPWGGLLGQIMTVVDAGGAGEQIDAPITSITWTSGDNPRTTVQTGFATGG